MNYQVPVWFVLIYGIAVAVIYFAAGRAYGHWRQLPDPPKEGQ